MRRFVAAVSLLALSAIIAPAKMLPGDAKRGSELIRSQNCIKCHSFGGEGGVSAPDLGKARGRNYTPSSMASTMWNHAPEMWTSMEKQGTARPVLTEPQAADLFAYFHSIRYFDKPGDAARGRRAFVASHCAECHDRSKPVTGGGPPITSWKSLTSPIVFAQRMWNHAPQMEAAMAAKKIKWVRLTGPELTDILVYIQSFPETRGKEREFSLTATGQGETLFKEKCFNCHQGKLSLETRQIGGTVTDFAVAMWNHSPNMAATARRNDQARPTLQAEEMRDIVSYLWNRQIFAENGSSSKGARVFEKKNCASCHNEHGGGGPDLKQWLAKRQDPMRPISMVSVLWQHGPTMLEGMKAKNLPWPIFSQAEMVDLISYLNSLNSSTTARSE
jgi:mono/diheme cytochrome c family protein